MDEIMNFFEGTSILAISALIAIVAMLFAIHGEHQIKPKKREKRRS
jgi:hypothetical protein